MKASRAAIRQSKALVRIEEKLDRVLVLLGEAPPSEPDRAETMAEDIIQEMLADETVIEEAAAEEVPAEAKPKGKPKG